MAKKAIHLTENELKQMIYEEVKEAFDKSKNHEIIDISEIDIDILKSAYYDLRLTPTITVYGDILSNLPSINEGVGDILPPDTVVKNLIKKYGLPPQLVLKREAFNKIYIYVITALIGKNDKLIEQDMQKMGYFLGYRQPPQTINGMIYQVLQFVLIPPVFEPFKTNESLSNSEEEIEQIWNRFSKNENEIEKDRDIINLFVYLKDDELINEFPKECLDLLKKSITNIQRVLESGNYDIKKEKQYRLTVEEGLRVIRF